MEQCWMLRPPEDAAGEHPRHQIKHKAQIHRQGISPLGAESHEQRASHQQPAIEPSRRQKSQGQPQGD